MVKPIVPLKGGDEYDALTGWRKFLHWKPGQKRAARRSYWKRVRQLFRKGPPHEQA